MTHWNRSWDKIGHSWKKYIYISLYLDVTFESAFFTCRNSHCDYMHEQWAELALNIYKCSSQILDVLVSYFTNLSNKKKHESIYLLTFQKVEIGFVLCREPVKPTCGLQVHLCRGLLHPRHVIGAITKWPDWAATGKGENISLLKS